MGTPLGYRYSGSPVIVDDGSPEPADDIVQYTQVARPGHRLPHAWLMDGRSTLDLVDKVYTLIEVEGDTLSKTFQAAAEKRGVPLVIHHIHDPQLRELFASRAVIVRPDHHVAWRDNGKAFDVDKVFDVLTGRAKVLSSGGADQITRFECVSSEEGVA
ncbi:2,4-dichlorophenol 6-monooxygenase [compost metagenome]